MSVNLKLSNKDITVQINNMTKIRQQLAEILTDLKVDRIGYVDTIDKIEKLYRKEIFPTKDIFLKKIKLDKSNKMPETLLDDDIADWEKDNLESK